MKYLKNYLILVGALCHIVALVALWWLFKQYDLTPRQFLVRAIEKIGVESELATSILKPPSMFPSYLAKAQVKDTAGRILPQARKILAGQIKITDFESQNIKQYHPCSQNEQLLGALSCWLYEQTEETERNLVRLLEGFVVELPNQNGEYGNGWELAVAYDALRNNPILNSYQKEIVERKITRALEHYLLLLNGSGPSLWHGRATITAQAWLAYIALSNVSENLARDAESHFMQLVGALELTQAWPEGYNYWINNRALTTVLALGAYLNGVEPNENHSRILALIEKIGDWHIWATRPDNRIEPIGDKGPRLDLKDETRRVIDLIAQYTQLEKFTVFSNYIEKLHGAESYYRGYRWGFILFNDPVLYNRKKGKDSLSQLGEYLPKSNIFGEENYGLAFIRQNWSPSGTFISFKAGDTFTHHGHYDSGHFTIFKDKPLIVNSSEYGGYKQNNRLNYAIRTVAKNSILIQEPNEKVKPNRFFTQNVADGGQRVTLPTGSTIDSVDDWFSKRATSPGLIGGKILSFEDGGDFAYISSDLTKAYNSTWFDANGEDGKVSSVTRDFVYLRALDTVISLDFIKTTNPDYRVKSLLHMVKKPKIKTYDVVKGSENNGILKSEESEFIIQNGEASANVKVLLDGYLQFVGGYDYKFYVEHDGDDTTLDGYNFNEGLSDKQINNAPDWRAELVSNIGKTEHYITSIIQLSNPTLEKNYSVKENEQYIKLVFPSVDVYFLKNGFQQLNNTDNNRHSIILGIKELKTYQLTMRNQTVMLPKGKRYFKSTQGAYILEALK